MPPVRVNRRRFLGCSAAASLALSQGNLAEAAAIPGQAVPVRLGLIGAGNRGTALLRAVLDLPGTAIGAICDSEARHRQRGQGIVEKARGHRPAVCDDYRGILDRADIDAVIAALPCDLHESVYGDAIKSGKHLYAEKPLGLTLAGCDALIAAAGSSPRLAVHVGFQRRSNPRFREAIALVQRGELGELIEARASWTSSNGPLCGQDGWMGRRDRSGDWMVEQAVHLWDVFAWVAGGLPARASGWGRRGLFQAVDPKRDVTDHYAVELEWPNGFRASLVQSWIAPAEDGFTGSALRVLGDQGGIDFSTGSVTFRDRRLSRRSIEPGPVPDTRLALEAFLEAIRSAPEAIPSPPVTLAEARAATLIGLLARAAVDEQRVVTMEEVGG
jgi:predicted dehydrogenase